MTYFTRFPINMTRRQTRSILASPYKLHAAIAGSFPATRTSHTENGRILWRVDRQIDGSMILYIVSPEIPSLVGLDEQIGFPDLNEQQWKTRDYKPFLGRIEAGQEYSFRLVGNPIISRKAIKSERGSSKRMPHLTTLQQAGWLAGKEAYRGTNIVIPEPFVHQTESRAMRNGFTICSNEPNDELSLIVSDSRKISFKKGPEDKTITLAMARFDGILKVIDADKLRFALTHGIGHAKGFGCGLLTLVPKGD